MEFPRKFLIQMKLHSKSETEPKERIKWNSRRKFMIQMILLRKSETNPKERKTGGLWPLVASNSTELTFFPLLILVGGYLLLLVIVTGENKVN